MKVSMISPAFTSVSKSQSFKGLTKSEHIVNDNTHYDWGLEAEIGEKEDYYNVTYYPFADETDELIEKNMAKLGSGTKTYEMSDEEINRRLKENPHASLDLSTSTTGTNVYLGKKLDITQAQYNDYKQRRLLSKEEDAVEDELKRNGLQSYLA